MRLNFTKLILSSFLPIAAFGQSLVSTTPENKKIILEEFTGINCVYCPQGHAIANQIVATHPGNAFVINVHQGGFATPSGSQPDFRTPFGNAIVNQSYSGAGFGYPSGTVNRHNFPGREMTQSGTTAMGRDKWLQSANDIAAQPSYLNVGTEAEVTTSGRVITVAVEVYYTGNSPVDKNYLNVALLQNNTLGPQTGGNQGNNYNHMHRLVHMITGQWGDEITATTQGTLITRTYTYEVPVHYNSIFTNVAELEVVAFVTESTQEIVSGNGAMVSVIPSDYDNDLGLFDIAQIQTQCENDVVAKASLMNVGTTDVNSVDINYSINGGTAQTFTWTGTLAVNGFTVVDIPIQGFELEDVNTIELSLANDDNNSNNVKTTTFNKAVETSNSLILNLRTDGYGSECRWNVKNSNGEIVAQGNGYGNNQNLTIPITLEGEDCFTFNLIDSYGDGGAPITLRDHNNVIIYQTNGGYGSGETANFSTDGTMGVEDVNISNVQIYPNPSNGIINIALEKDAKIEVYDVTGRSIYAGNAKAGDNSINLTGKGKGTFVVKITEGANRITKKVIIK